MRLCTDDTKKHEDGAVLYAACQRRQFPAGAATPMPRQDCVRNGRWDLDQQREVELIERLVLDVRAGRLSTFELKQAKAVAVIVTD